MLALVLMALRPAAAWVPNIWAPAIVARTFASTAPVAARIFASSPRIFRDIDHDDDINHGYHSRKILVSKLLIFLSLVMYALLVQQTEAAYCV